MVPIKIKLHFISAQTFGWEKRNENVQHKHKMWKSISIRKIKNNTTPHNPNVIVGVGWLNAEDGWHVLTRSYSFSELIVTNLTTYLFVPGL